MQLTVAPSENGLPLLQFLAGRLALSRRKAKEIIDQRRVFVNGKRIWMARHRLKTGDTITGLLGLEQAAGERPIPVIYEDNDYLIVNKPAGIESNGKDSVEELLNERSANNRLPATRHSRQACHALRVACHRLDKDTSGCLIFAKHHAAKERIIPLFARHKISKFYQAVIAGCLPEKSTTITKPLEGQRAVSHVRVIDESIRKIGPEPTPSAMADFPSKGGDLMKFRDKPLCSPPGRGTRPVPPKRFREGGSGGWVQRRQIKTFARQSNTTPLASHVSIRIETGRTHQIRKHLASIGHPVLGDQQYGGSRALTAVERLVPRQMLHAAEIAFVSPLTGKSIRCRAEPPDDFKDCLKRYHLK